jgi:hypothetical protein
MLHHVVERANPARIRPTVAAQTLAVRFEIRYANGARQVVAPPEHLLIVGRDPTCDVILRDDRCSRRHAVIEETRLGPVIRDSASLNGIYLNGERIERALLATGDEIRLGDTRLTLLDDAAGQTEVPAADFSELPRAASAILFGGAPEGAQSQPLPPPGVLSAPSADVPRPLTVTTLALLWLCSVPLSFGTTILLLLARDRWDLRAALVALTGLALTLLGVLLGPALFARRPWARVVQILLCVPAALSCVLAPAGLVAAAYCLGRRTRAHFLTPAAEPLTSGSARRRELAFTLALAASLLLAVLGCGAAMSYYRTPLLDALVGPASREDAVLARLRAVRSAQESFRRVCNTGYADLEGLRNPASAIPDYPPHGAGFLPDELTTPEAHGYRFDLSVQGPMPPTQDCPTLRRFRSYRYLASPASGLGRSFLLASDRGIFVAAGRQPTLDDPAVE